MAPPASPSQDFHILPFTPATPSQDFHILPFTPTPLPRLAPRGTAPDPTLITLLSLLGAATLLSALAIFLIRRRLTRRKTTACTGRAVPDVESPPETRACVPGFSNRMIDAMAGHDARQTEVRLPRSTEDLKKLGRETRMAWKAETLDGEADVGGERMDMIPLDDAGSRGWPLTTPGAAKPEALGEGSAGVGLGIVTPPLDGKPGPFGRSLTKKPGSAVLASRYHGLPLELGS